MKKRNHWLDLVKKGFCMAAVCLCMNLATADAALACGGGGGGGNGAKIGGGSSDGSISGLFDSYSMEDIYRIFGWPAGGGASQVHKKAKPSLGSQEDLEKMYVNENFTKPSHWTAPMWKQFLKKRQAYREKYQDEANQEKRYHEKKYTAAVVTSVGASIASAGVGIAAAGTTAAAAVTTVSIIGDGLGAGAGALAEGKSYGEAASSGLKKAFVSTVMSKVKLGNDAAEGAAGFTVGYAYDNGPAAPTNLAPPPEYVSPGDATRYSAIPDHHTVQQ
jgi:hypothetical protein